MERITSRQNPFLKQIGKLNNAKSERRRAGVYPGEGPKLLEEAVKAGVKITATVSCEGVDVPEIAGARRHDTVDIKTADLSRSAVVIGSEGKGISDALLNMSEKTLKIPMRERCESLNAAAAATIVLWEMYR